MGWPDPPRSGRCRRNGKRTRRRKCRALRARVLSRLQIRPLSQPMVHARLLVRRRQSQTLQVSWPIPSCSTGSSLCRMALAQASERPNPSTATPRQPPPVVSPVPIPSYAFSHKRSSTAMSGTPEAPSSKRQQVDHANAGASARSGTPKATVSAKSQPTTETAAPQTLSQSMKPQPPAETSEILTPAGTSFYQPWRPPSTQNTLSLTPTDGRVTPQGQGRKDVEVGSTNATIIKRVDGRRYVEYKGLFLTAYWTL